MLLLRIPGLRPPTPTRYPGMISMSSARTELQAANPLLNSWLFAPVSHGALLRFVATPALYYCISLIHE